MSEVRLDRRTVRGRARLAGAIYGTILATAVVVGESLDSNVTAGEAAISVVVTIFVFWLAHVYASIVAERFTLRRWLEVAEMRHIASMEWPLVEAGIPPTLLLLIGAAGVYGRWAAFTLAMWSGVAALFIWGLAYTRREGGGVLAALLVGTLNALLGVLIIGLKVFAH